MIEPTDADIGRSVIYQGGHPDDREEGTITSFNPHIVFVHYRGGVQGTNREDLSWSHTETRAQTAEKSLGITKTIIPNGLGDVKL